jgi:hypothetical protein
MKKTILVVLLVFLASVLTAAAGSKLDIDNVEITSGTKTLTTGTSGSFKVTQGDEIRIKVKLENTYSDSSDNDIEDVNVIATIRDIDDGDDIEDEVDETYVRADGFKTVTLELDIPSDADPDQSYDLEITAKGTDANGTVQQDDADFEIEIKENTKEEDDERDAEDRRYLDEYYSRKYQPSDRVERPVEPYVNPNRDLSFLYRGGEQQVVIEVPPQIPRIPTTPAPAHKDSMLSIIALIFANIAIVVFIAMLINAYKSQR